MPAWIDISGKEFHRLTAVSYLGASLWSCLCQCGVECTSLYGNLSSGRQKSCGCLNKENVKSQLIDISGKRYNRLTVVSFAGHTVGNHPCPRWLCRCDCGVEKIVIGGKLRSGSTKSCGCLNRENLTSIKIDLSGRKFGRLLVIALAGRRSGKNKSKVQYLCSCDCGTEKITDYASLTTGLVRSCGCLFDEKRSTQEQKISNNRRHGNTRRARTKGMPSLFSDEHLRFMMDYWHHACSICEKEEGQFWHIAYDHWVPLSDSANCPGTVPWNMLPMCSGKKGISKTGIKSCNLSKWNKDPIIWLIERFGYDIAETKLAAIEAYFAIAREKFPS